MIVDNDYAITQMHICSFERKNGILVFDMNKYPERTCVFDKKNKIIIDVETFHQYPYVRVLNHQMFYDIEEVKTLRPDKRVGCMEYATFDFYYDEKTLKRCARIIKMLKQGKIFPNGNDELTNEEYLAVINRNKNVQKTKKIGGKRK